MIKKMTSRGLFCAISISVSSLLGFSQQPHPRIIQAEASSLIALESELLSASNPSSLTAQPAQKKGVDYAAGATKAVLSVTPNGGIGYTVPVVVPDGVKDFAPAISLVYDGQAGNGDAGYGWNIGGLSRISRIAATPYYDGYHGAVHANGYDRFAFDGKRLLLKSGVYGQSGSTYQTENFSNIRIVARGNSRFGSDKGPAYFIVYHPDGNRVWYGSESSSHGRLSWMIHKVEDPQGNTMRYFYIDDDGVPLISRITYGSKGGKTAPNSIEFTYESRYQKDQFYIGDRSFHRNKILLLIHCNVAGKMQRGYVLRHGETSLGYQVLNNITEWNATNKPYPPITFDYGQTSDHITRKKFQGQNMQIFPGVNRGSMAFVAGDFNTDGYMDMVIHARKRTDKLYFFLELQKSGALNTVFKYHVKPFDQLINSSILTRDHKLLNQGITAIEKDKLNGEVHFRSYIMAPSGLSLHHERTWNAPVYPETGPGDLHDGAILPMHYLSGDFDGDGITDILAITHPYSYEYDCQEDNWDNLSCEFMRIEYSQAYLISLDPRKTTNFVTNLGKVIFPINSGSELTIADCNGDGRSDLVHFMNNRVMVYGLNGKKKLRQLWRTDNPGITTEFPKLIGDYNGDGKIDFATPNVDIPDLSGMNLVHSLEQYGAGMVRKQEYRYRGAISHVSGMGYLGFSNRSQSNWHGDGVGRLWTNKRFDPFNKSLIQQQWTGESQQWTPSDYIALNTYTHTNTTFGSKLFINAMTKTVVDDRLIGEKITKEFRYDAYQNPVAITTTYRGGSSKQTIKYSNNPLARDATYHIGRPLEETELRTLGAETYKTSKKFRYANNLLIGLDKKGNGSETLTYAYSYDSFGNLVQRVSPGFDAPQVEQWTYNHDGRFLLSETDHLGLKTQYTYDVGLGAVASVKDPYGLTTTMQYDGWGREVSRTNPDGKTTTTRYTRYGGATSGNMGIVVDYPEGADAAAWYNVWGWKTGSQTLGLNNRYYKTSYRYDVSGRLTGQSAPFVDGGQAMQWTRFYFDVYGRPIKQAEYSGKSIQTSYDKLTVTVNDGVKTVRTTKDAIGNIVSMTDPGGTINYQYYANGSVKQADYGGYRIKTTIDQWGRKVRLDDPSAGVYTYRYTKSGHLLEETTPNGRTIYGYSKKGILESLVQQGDNTQMATKYTYDALYRKIGVVGRGQDNQVYEYSYGYDAKNRLIHAREKVGGPHASGDFKKQIQYDSFGRPSGEVYISKNQRDGSSSLVAVRNVYNNTGIRTQIRDQSNNASLWELTKETERGQVSEMLLGNGMIQSRKFDGFGNLTRIHDYESVNGKTHPAMHMNYAFDPKRGMLLARDNKVFTHREVFEHDSQNRLTKISGAVQERQSYNDQGTIKNNSILGQYSYLTAGKQYQLKDIALNPQGVASYKDKPLREIAYNAYKKPVKIHEHGIERIDFDYGPMSNRTHAYFGNLETDKQKRTYHKYYSSIIPVEIIHKPGSKDTKFITYIGGNAYSAPLAHIDERGTTPSAGFHYLHRDYLGSIMAISDSGGTIMEQQHYGAWGSLLKEKRNHSSSFLPQGSLLGRGYTGHEHFSGVGLIHMNGRMYDSILRRFLSPDNFVQDPLNTQSFNRYGYVWNSPLQFTDPSGEEFITAIVIGIGVLAGAYFGGVQSNDRKLNPKDWNFQKINTWYGMIGGAVIGGATAVVAPAVAGPLTKAAAAAGIKSGFLGGAMIGGGAGLATGALSGGFMTMLPGGSGKFLKGAYQGALSGMISGAVIGGIVGAITTPKGHSRLTGKPFRPKASSIDLDIQTSGISSLDDVPQLSAEGINAQPAGMRTIDGPKSPTIKTGPDGKMGGNFNLSAVDDGGGASLGAGRTAAKQWLQGAGNLERGTLI